MSPGKRILINVIATYGRSLYALVLGVFTARWALNALGQVDYGLSGVVGGLSGFVSFLNSILSFSVSRFYSVSVGAERMGGRELEAIEDCRKWFNAALLIHTVVPVALMAVGYPIGEWAVRCFLTIPVDRLQDCVWVWRFACISCFVGMVSVPFNAMYAAKQDIAELTVYGFAISTLNALFLYYMITHPGVWLYRFALWGCVISVVPAVIQMIRAFYKYQECRFNKAYLYDIRRLKDIVVFGAARFWTMLSNVVSGQGNAILVNKFLEPAFNASMTLGNTVVNQASSLSSALTGAFSPAIMNAAGEGDPEKVRCLSFQVCRMGALLVFVFALPLALEAEEVLTLWLKNPPPYVVELMIAILIDSVLERMTEGLYMPIIAFGNGMVRYSWWAGWCGMSRFAMALALLLLGFGLYGICIALVAARVAVVVMRLYMGAKLAGMSWRYWLRTVFVPLVVCGSAALLLGRATCMMNPSFWRVVATTIVCEVSFLPLAWFFVLERDERSYVLKRIRGIVKKCQCS